MNNPALIELKDVTKTYPNHAKPILDGLNFTLQPGNTALLGPSGSGKSTLLAVLAGLLAPDQGTILWQGSPQFSGRFLSIVFQQFHLIPHLTALENLLILGEFRGELRPTIERDAEQWLKKLGLYERRNQTPEILSGGEKQRLAIARSLLTGPKVLLADEPSGNLDAATADSVMNSLFQWAEEKNTALVLVTHNQELARRCDRIYSLKNGKLE